MFKNPGDRGEALGRFTGMNEVKRPFNLFRGDEVFGPGLPYWLERAEQIETQKPLYPVTARSAVVVPNHKHRLVDEEQGVKGKHLQ